MYYVWLLGGVDMDVRRQCSLEFGRGMGNVNVWLRKRGKRAVTFGRWGPYDPINIIEPYRTPLQTIIDDPL